MKPGWKTTEAWATAGYAGLVVEFISRPDLTWPQVAALAVLAVPLSLYTLSRKALKENTP